MLDNQKLHINVSTLDPEEFIRSGKTQDLSLKILYASLTDILMEKYEGDDLKLILEELNSSDKVLEYIREKIPNFDSVLFDKFSEKVSESVVLDE